VPLDQEGSETRKRTDDVIEYIIGPAVAQHGFEVIAPHRIATPGIISRQVIEHIARAELVIADLTDQNPNVFYELALRHAVRKPLIQIIQKGQKIPFDVAQQRTVEYGTDVSGAARAKDEISMQVKEIIEKNIEVENPISIAVKIEVVEDLAHPEDLPGPGPLRSLLGTLLIGHQIRWALIERFGLDWQLLFGDKEPHFKEIEEILEGIMRASVNKAYLSPDVVLAAFDSDEDKKEVTGLFGEFGEFYPMLREAIESRNEVRVEKALDLWRSNNSRWTIVASRRFYELAREKFAGDRTPGA
jgi:hypothetical protein